MSTATKLATNNDLYHTKILAQMSIDAIKADKATEAIANLDGLVNFVSQFPCDATLGEHAVETPTSPASEPKPAGLTPEVREVLEDAAANLKHMLEYAGLLEDSLDQLLHPELFEEALCKESDVDNLANIITGRAEAVIANLGHNELAALSDVTGAFLEKAVVKALAARGLTPDQV
jgi:hypothetical protein